jgi:dihydroorotate dehydrogenase (NAD+) catalytic subunit
MIEALEGSPAIAAYELNVSCPNVHSGLIVGESPSEAEALVARLRPLTERPLIVKLTPNTACPDEVARAVESTGADAVSLINTLKAMAIDPATGRPWLGARTGGLSGPAIRPIALAQVATVAEAVTVPLIGMGGIESGADARDFLNAGASIVAVGTASFRDPAAGARIREELERLLVKGARSPQSR